MIRTQIQLTEEQYRRLKLAAHGADVAMAELIRRAVDRWLCETSAETQYARALQVLGKFADNAGDVSERHDDYLQEIWTS